MAKLIDKLWNWGHLEGSHNQWLGMDLTMTPEEFGEVYGIRNSFMVSSKGNIQPPFDALADRTASLKKVCWSILGDASTPLPEHPLGETEEILRCAATHSNVVGGVIDDFHAPGRQERFTPPVLSQIRARLNENGKDFYAVLYEFQIREPATPVYYNCVDVITYWIWEQKEIDNLDTHIDNLFRVFPENRKMLGMYLWGYGDNRPMDLARFQKQLHAYMELLKQGKIEGIIFCSGCVGDAPLLTNKYLKAYLAENGDLEI